MIRSFRKGFIVFQSPLYTRLVYCDNAGGFTIESARLWDRVLDISPSRHTFWTIFSEKWISYCFQFIFQFEELYSNLFLEHSLSSSLICSVFFRMTYFEYSNFSRSSFPIFQCLVSHFNTSGCDYVLIPYLPNSFLFEFPMLQLLKLSRYFVPQPNLQLLFNFLFFHL